MSFDELQSAWQHQRASLPPTPTDPDALRRVQADSRMFSRRIFWRDVREVAASIVVAIVFGNIAWSAQSEGSPAWPAWVAAVLPLGVAAFFIADRWISRRRATPQGDTLLVEIERALQAVNHQISLLRNVAWWYLLPLMLSGVFLVLQIVLYAPMEVPPVVALVVKIGVGLIALVPMFAFNVFIWKLNQKAVREDLQPRADGLAAQRQDWLEAGQA